jgi:hypothetical protein
LPPPEPEEEARAFEEPELAPPEPEEEALVSEDPEIPLQEEPSPLDGEEPAEENPDDELFFPEDAALKLSPDDEESIFSDEIPEDPAAAPDAAWETEDARGEEEPGETAPREENPLEEEAAAEEEFAPEEEPAAAEEEFAPEEEPAATEEEFAPEEEPATAEEEFAPEKEAAAADEPVLEELEGETSAGETPAGSVSAGENSFGRGPDKPLEPEAVAKLLDYLKELARALPTKDEEEFLNSDIRLSLEFLIDVLRGRKGLYKDIKARMGEDPEILKEEPAEAPAPSKVAGTLTYLEQLASALPDHDLSAAITRKTDAIIAGIKQSSGETLTEKGLKL